MLYVFILFLCYFLKGAKKSDQSLTLQFSFTTVVLLRHTNWAYFECYQWFLHSTDVKQVCCRIYHNTSITEALNYSGVRENHEKNYKPLRDILHSISKRCLLYRLT